MYIIGKKKKILRDKGDDSAVNTPVAPENNLSSVPSTYMLTHITLCYSSSTESHLFWSPQT